MSLIRGSFSTGFLSQRHMRALRDFSGLKSLKRQAPWRRSATLAAVHAVRPETSEPYMWKSVANAIPVPVPAKPVDLPKRSEEDRREELNRTLSMLNDEVSDFERDSLEILRWSMDRFSGKLAMSTSFGIQSAVLLHMATQIKPDIPIVWVDTGYLPAETYQYAEQLTEVLNLNLIVKSNERWSPARMEAVYGKLWESEDPSAHALYGKLRKVEPLQEGLNSIKPNPKALLSGLRAAQTKARSNMKVVGFQNNRFKVLPMLKMTDDDVAEYMDKYDLPRHPLESKGYVTVGDWHSSRPVQEGEDARNTRFGGKFQECGLHVDESAHEEVAKSSTKNELSSFTATNVSALNDTEAHPETDVAVILVKKIMEDGSFCRKCNDVAQKIEADNLSDWIGYTTYVDMREKESEGLSLAKHFEVATAPFFLVRSKASEESNEEWKVVNSYLQLRKMLQKAHKSTSARSN